MSDHFVYYRFREEIREEDEESSVPRLTVSEVVEPIVEETDNTEVNNDTSKGLVSFHIVF